MALFLLFHFLHYLFLLLTFPTYSVFFSVLIFFYPLMGLSFLV
jgi:hypothetical protein